MRRAAMIPVLFVPFIVWAQSVPDPDSLLIGDRQLPKVLLVGCFHFEYYDLDAHVTDKGQRVNVKEPRRQKEMEELVNYIARFKPTAIAVEAGPNTGRLIDRYQQYLRTDSITRADEVAQIGFRLMKRFKLDTLYGVDTGTLLESLWTHKDSAVMHPLLDSIYTDWDFTSDDPVSQRYSAYHKAADSYRAEHTLLQSFMFMNADKSYDRDYGAYLAGDFKLGRYRGADALAMHWYARNLRIFRNIQELHLKPNDRLVVLYGAGHMGVLKQLFDSSVEFERVRFGDL